MDEPLPLESLLEYYEVMFDETKRGNQQILCPAHEETTPSCSVNLDLALINCFGCGLGGSAIDLVMMVEGKDFRDAASFAKRVADESGREVRPKPSGRMAISAGNKRRGRPYKPPWSV